MGQVIEACGEPRTPPTLEWHLNPANRPKRILGLDGGGVRGTLSLQYLFRMEDILRRRYGRPRLVLSDYFDLIGGTSTGAIIATGLALGFDIAKLQKLYDTVATRVFKKPFLRIGAIVPKFGNAGLEEALKSVCGASTRLGSPELKTGLMIMTKRMDTGKPWPLTNNPRDPYFGPQLGKRRIGNANMLLWQLIRASTAAPHYFRPEDIVVGQTLDPQTGAGVFDHGQFVDGGVSTANNPSFQLLKVALLKGFEFNWHAGEDSLMLVSVGTGLARRGKGRARFIGATAGAFAFSALLSLMADCNDEVETIMQWLSDGPLDRRIDGQIGTLGGDVLGGRALLTYRRYNVVLESAWLQDQLGLDLSQDDLDLLSRMDRPAGMTDLARLGAHAAARQLDPDHLPPGFDPWPRVT